MTAPTTRPGDRDDFFDEPEPVLGTVPETGRGSLPFALVHGESLVACAAWALGEAGVQILDASVPWSTVREAGRAWCLHDPLCPLTPADFIAECCRRAEADDVVVVGWRPVTDTVKEWRGGDHLGPTVDREGLRVVVSPVVLPARVVTGLEEPVLDAADLVDALAARHPIAWVEAPAAARRVASLEDLRVLEALTAAGRGSPGPRGR